tara:strand:- start:412 stop:1602 length:1191 start_codon:yes stop_codon:yes gene_type:complete
MKGKRICFLACYDIPLGASLRTWNLSKGLTNLGNEVFFITSNYNHLMPEKVKLSNVFYRKEKIDGVTVIWINSISYGQSNLLRFIHMALYSLSAFFVTLIEIRKIDFFIGTSVPLPVALVAYFLSILKKSKFVFEIRDVWPQELIDLGYISKNGIIAKILRKIEVFVAINADHIVSALPNVDNHLKEIDENLTFQYVPNPYDESLNCKPYDGGEQDKLKVLFIGGTGLAQDLETIIESFLVCQDTDIELTFVGPKKRVDSYLEGRNLNFDPKINTYETVKRDQIAKYINSADLLIHSVKDTGQLKFGLNSNKLLDYLSSDRPILLASEIESSIISVSGCGYDIEPENIPLMASYFKKICKMTPDSRISLGLGGSEFIKEFSVEKISQKVQNVLTRI